MSGDTSESMITEPERLIVRLPDVVEDMTRWNSTEPSSTPLARPKLPFRKSNVKPRNSCGKLSPSLEYETCTCALLKHALQGYQGWINSGCLQCINSPRLYTEFPRRTPKRIRQTPLRNKPSPSPRPSYHKVMAFVHKRLSLPQTPLFRRPKKFPRKKHWFTPFSQTEACHSIQDTKCDVRGLAIQHCFK